MHSYICIVAPHLGTLAETREGPDVELTKRWCWWAYLGDGRIGQVLDWRMLAKRIHLTKSNLSRIAGKPRSIISLLPSKQLILYMLQVLLH
jgi:hypothetical protein